MKKQIIAVCALIASVVAFAASVTSENTFGVLKISVAAGKQGLIIPVPWVAVGGGDIVVTNYVLSTNRHADGGKTGDRLYWYNKTDSNYYAWKIADGKWVEDKVYVVGSDESDISNSKTTQTFERGEALILELGEDTAASDDVYLSGQYSSTSVTTTVAGTTSGNKYDRVATLIAPPVASSSAFALSELLGKMKKSDVAAVAADIEGDMIRLADGITNFTYSTVYGGWFPKPTGATAAIPAGQGAYYSRNNEGDITIEW